MVLILKSSLLKLLDGPITFDIVHAIQTACKHNWWQTFLFVNNYLYFGDTVSNFSFVLLNAQFSYENFFKVSTYFLVPVCGLSTVYYGNIHNLFHFKI